MRQRKGVKPVKAAIRKSQKAKSIRLSSQDWYKRAAAAMSIRRDSPSIVPDHAKVM